MCGTGMTISPCCHSLAKKKKPKGTSWSSSAQQQSLRDNLIVTFSEKPECLCYEIVSPTEPPALGEHSLHPACPILPKGHLIH